MEMSTLYKALVTIGIVFGALSGGLARADAPSGAASEHVAPGMGMGQAGGGWAAMNRPANETEARAMKEVLCPCGTCTRLAILDCDCATAAQLRAKVQGLLVGVNLSSDRARNVAYDSVLAAFTSEYGDKVLSTPKSDTSWIFPSLAVLGGLGLLAAAGRRWIARGRRHSTQPVSMTAPSSSLDDAYADKLDDELAETD